MGNFTPASRAPFVPPAPVLMPRLMPNLMPLTAFFQSQGSFLPADQAPGQLTQGSSLTALRFFDPQLPRTPLSLIPPVSANPPIDLPAALAELNSLGDPGVRLDNYRNLLADLLDDKDFDKAIQLFQAAQADPALPVGGVDGMYQVLNQSLLEGDLHDRAIALNSHYPRAGLRDEVRRQILDYLITEGKVLQAAQLKGQANFTGVTRAELARLGRSAQILGRDIYDFWHRTVIGNSLAAQIAENATHDADAGRQYRLKSLDNGNLACAYSVSRIFDRTRLDQAVDSAECNTLASQLKKSGFTQVGGNRSLAPVARNFAYQAGDIIFFTRKNKNGYGHVAVIAKVEGDKVWMVHNSSAKRQVVEVMLNNYQRPVVAVMRPPAE